jgi:hypothetical protein
MISCIVKRVAAAQAAATIEGAVYAERLLWAGPPRLDALNKAIKTVMPSSTTNTLPNRTSQRLLQLQIIIEHDLNIRPSAVAFIDSVIRWSEISHINLNPTLTMNPNASHIALPPSNHFRCRCYRSGFSLNPLYLRCLSPFSPPPPLPTISSASDSTDPVAPWLEQALQNVFEFLFQFRICFRANSSKSLNSRCISIQFLKLAVAHFLIRHCLGN